MNNYDIIILIIVALLIFLAVYRMYKRKKSGKCIGCGGDCSSCIYHSYSGNKNKNTSGEKK